MKQLFRELKRRKVYHVAVTYAVVAFVTLQAAELIFPATTLEGIYDVLVVIAFVGFPLALVLAWAFEMTPEGVRRTSTGGEAETAGAPEDASFSTEERRSRSRRAMSALVALGLVGAAVAGGWYLTGGGGDMEPGVADRSIAVLPFEALGQEVRGPFTEGMHEDLLARLSNVSDFKVISRTTVQRYRDTDLTTAEIAEELGVRWVLEGGVQEMGEEIQVNAQLIDPRTDTHAWAESYRRDLTAVSLFDLQSEITRRIVRSLEAELTSGERERVERQPTEDLDAYRLYVRGRYYWHRRSEEDLLESARFFERAVERDPSYARAWSGLADAYAVLAFYDYLPPRTAYPRAKEAVTRALEIDETLAEAHASLGYITLYHGWDAARAEAEFRRAIELNPSYSVGHQWYANLLVATGRFDEAEREMSRAREVNPLSLIANGALGWVHYYAGRYHEAVAQCDRALRMNPDWDLGHLWRGLALVEMGRTEEALRSLERAVELSEESGITVAGLAHARAVAGRVESARDLLADLVRAGRQGAYTPSFEIAKVHVALDEPGEALDWLERALDERSHSMVFLEVDPQLAPLRSEPRFRQLVKRVGLEG